MHVDIANIALKTFSTNIMNGNSFVESKIGQGHTVHHLQNIMDF